jgi:hypothetical protein
MTLTVAVAAENCGTVAAGEKLRVVAVSGGGPAAKTVAGAKSVRADMAQRIDTVRFILEKPSLFNS